MDASESFGRRQQGEQAFVEVGVVFNYPFSSA